MIDDKVKLAKEREIFDQNVNVHDLPEIFHYWSNTYLRPMLEEYGVSNPDQFFAKYMLESAVACNTSNPVFVSVGSGNCDTEVRIAKLLKNAGLEQFSIECLDLSPVMLERGYQLAVSEGVSENLFFTEADFNKWRVDKTYTSVIANQSLHHVQNLEGLFAQVSSSLDENGSFIISDMIGRNGHQRWPEALLAVHKFWQELPDSHRYNHQLKRFEELYENWDCSNEGFEGIRAQDILPLLIENFHFEVFIPFANVIDIFIDRGFGHNYDKNKTWDTDFIDRVHECDEKLIQSGEITPTHLMAVLKKSDSDKHVFSRNLTPDFCVRNSNS
jgi:SAM-dependent methyltransferase